MLGGKVREIPGYALTPPIRIMVGTRLPLCRTISVPPLYPPMPPRPFRICRGCHYAGLSRPPPDNPPSGSA